MVLLRSFHRIADGSTARLPFRERRVWDTQYDWNHWWQHKWNQQKALLVHAVDTLLFETRQRRPMPDTNAATVLDMFHSSVSVSCKATCWCEPMILEFLAIIPD
jgi:hypothetical protein